MKTLHVLVVLLATSWTVSGQVLKDSVNIASETKKNLVHLELLGRCLVFGSVNYELKLKPRLSLGVGLGYANANRSERIRGNNGINEKGKNFESSTSQILYAQYFVGKRQHKLLLTAGTTHLLVTNTTTYPSEKLGSFESDWVLNAGFGYQYTAKRLIYRATAYGLKLPKPSGLLPTYLPWLGLTVGYQF